MLFIAMQAEDSIPNSFQALLVLHGTAVNQDGRSSSLTAPKGPAQQQCIQESLQLSQKASQVGLPFLALVWQELTACACFNMKL